MPKAWIYSVILHIAAFIVVYFGLPSLTNKKILEDQAITVEILPISEVTNVKHREVKPEVKPQPKKEVTAAVEPKQSLPDPSINLKPVFTPEVVPEPKIKKKEEMIKEKTIESLVEPKPKVVEKPQKKPQKEVEQTPEELFAAVLKSVEEIKVEEEEQEKSEQVEFSEIEDLLSSVKEEEKKYKPGLPLSLSEKDAIKQQIIANWSLSSVSGGKDAGSMVVTLFIKVARDGAVQDVQITNKLRYSSDTFFRAMADSTVRAVLKSSPLKNLPLEKYDVKDGWREMEINFDPSEMFY